MAAWVSVKALAFCMTAYARSGKRLTTSVVAATKTPIAKVDNPIFLTITTSNLVTSVVNSRLVGAFIAVAAYKQSWYIPNTFGTSVTAPVSSSLTRTPMKAAFVKQPNGAHPEVRNDP